MTWKYTVILLVAVSNGVLSWRWNLPNLPSGKRTEYFLAADGEYKYGYDTGKGQFAKQAGDAQNEVSGHYIYKDPTGKNVDVKYTAGVKGFVPEGLEKLLPQTKGPHTPVQGYSYNAPAIYASSDSTDDQANTGDASYNFAIDTDTYKRQESSDASGNVQGKYSYSNEAGQHDLSYIAGSNTGFVATSGSLSYPNGLEGKAVPLSHSSATNFGGSSKSSSSYTPTIPNADGSYSFEYSTNDQSRHESSDVSGNVQGRYAYTNEAGAHDLSYVAGSATGFQVTGGSLAAPNGLTGHAPMSYSASSGYLPPYAAANSAAYTPAIPNPDGSYSFEYSTGDSSRMESADASGNIQGKYSFTNKAGTHDLSYVAGSATGFQPTGGNLAGPAIPSAYSTSSVASGNLPPTSYAEESQDDQANTGDSSYSFTIDTDEYKRHESSDAKGNVKGSYTYKNEAGSHDLNYVAGSETGFKPVSGSLAMPNGLAGMSSAYPVPSTSGYLPPTAYASETHDDQANTGDSSYNFNIDTDEYKRHESSDAQGNVQGGYTYKNAAGTHDLSYIAGSATGFRATGGSLALPNGLPSDVIQTTYTAPTTYTATNTYQNTHSSGQDDESNSGDASYSFVIDTSDYQRKESADSQGNVQGTYTYKNAAGSHDLTYVAGSATGFATKSGSLAVPNGIRGSNVPTTSYLPPQGRAYAGSAASNQVSSDAAHVYSENKIGNLLVKNFQPSKTLDRYGYIFEES